MLEGGATSSEIGGSFTGGGKALASSDANTSKIFSSYQRGTLISSPSKGPDLALDTSPLGLVSSNKTG